MRLTSKSQGAPPLLAVLGLAGLVALSTACGPSRTLPDGGGEQEDAGCRNCPVDAGPRAVTVAESKSVPTCTERVALKGVVVTAVEYAIKGSQNDYLARFWVTDPASPGAGIYVDKHFTDPTTGYEPKVGDVVNLEGYFYVQPRFTDRVGYRRTLKSTFNCPKPNDGGKLLVTKVEAKQPLPDNGAPAGFGNSSGGKDKPNAGNAGARMHLPGPLSLTNARPAALKRLSALAGDNAYFGFEVSGGVLVNDGREQNDGGVVQGCGWQAVAADGGMVTFPNGIRGVWDTYTHAACYDGGVGEECKRDAGSVPGTATDYTYVLYPTDCATDFAGAQVTK